MAEIINSTVKTITLIETKPKKKDFKEYKIRPMDSKVIPDAVWARMKKNRQVKRLLNNKDLLEYLVVPTFWEKLKRFFY